MSFAAWASLRLPTTASTAARNFKQDLCLVPRDPWRKNPSERLQGMTLLWLNMPTQPPPHVFWEKGAKAQPT
jgi:hypothetical protein